MLVLSISGDGACLYNAIVDSCMKMSLRLLSFAEWHVSIFVRTGGTGNSTSPCLSRKLLVLAKLVKMTLLNRFFFRLIDLFLCGADTLILLFLLICAI